MSRKTVSGILTALLCLCILLSAINVKVYADLGTITIKANGEVEPDTAPIEADEHNITYTITDNIIDSKIVIERDHIILDGQGYKVKNENYQYTTAQGLTISQRTNVTVMNVTIEGFRGEGSSCGILIDSSTRIFVHHCKILNNILGIFPTHVNFTYIYKNEIDGFQQLYAGIDVDVSDNVEIAYNIIKNYVLGINLYTNNTLIYHNIIRDNSFGICIVTTSVSPTEGACHNTITRNDFSNGQYDLDICYYAHDNLIYHNNFTTDIFHDETPRYNALDGGYPCCGNYWKTCNETNPPDDYKGRYQNKTGHDHIADNPYDPTKDKLNDTNLMDNYPLMLPVNTFVNCSGDPNATCPLKCDINNDGIVNMRDLWIVCNAQGTEPGDSKWNWFADVNNDLIVNTTDIDLVYDDCWKRFPHV